MATCVTFGGSSLVEKKARSMNVGMLCLFFSLRNIHHMLGSIVYLLDIDNYLVEALKKSLTVKERIWQSTQIIQSPTLIHQDVIISVRPNKYTSSNTHTNLSDLSFSQWCHAEVCLLTIVCSWPLCWPLCIEIQLWTTKPKQFYSCVSLLTLGCIVGGPHMYKIHSLKPSPWQSNRSLACILYRRRSY